MPDEHDPRPPKSGGAGNDADLWRYASSGTQLAATVGGFLLLGWWIDQSLGWSPWGMVVFGMAGICAGLYHFLKDALK